MYHSDEAFAMMLLTLSLSPMGEGALKPLSPEEVAAVAGRLDISSSNKLGSLLGQDMFSLQRILSIDEESAYRLCLLLGRDMLLSRLIEDCAAKGIEVLSPFDAPYPAQLRLRLGDYQSPVLFTKGDLTLFEGNYIGILGISGIRTSPELKKGIEHLMFESALNGFGLITGEEAGVCRLGAGFALENESRLVCALTGGFEDFVGDEGHAYALENGNMLAVGISHPASKPNPASAPLRNRVVFGLSKAAFVLTTDGRRGEADAARKKLCDHIYVLDHPSLPANAALTAKGFEPICDLTRFDVAAACEKWREPEVQQISFL